MPENIVWLGINDIPKGDSNSLMGLSSGMTFTRRVIFNKEVIVNGIEFYEEYMASERKFKAVIYDAGTKAKVGESEVLTKYSASYVILKFLSPVTLKASREYRVGLYVEKGSLSVYYDNISSGDTTLNKPNGVEVIHKLSTYYLSSGDGFPVSATSSEIIFGINYDDNTEPTLTLNTTDNQTITQNQPITIPTETPYQFKITASDEDTDQTLQYKVSVAGVETVPLTSITKDTKTLVSVDKSKFAVGMNAILVTVRDSEGGETSLQFNIIVDANMPIDSSCLANMKFNGYSLSTLSLAELVNHLE